MTEQLETTFIDKSAWPRGPWDAEPDEVQWVDAATGLDCLAVRQPSAGHWCGYVGVPEAHPLFGKDYDACHEQRPGLSVHGGLTFASLCNEKDAEHGICCHVPQPGRPDRVWWLGFDCAHAGDVSPGYAHFRDGGTRPWETYRTLAYVRDECARLAAQLWEAAAPGARIWRCPAPACGTLNAILVDRETWPATCLGCLERTEPARRGAGTEGRRDAGTKGTGRES